MEPMLDRRDPALDVLRRRRAELGESIAALEQALAALPTGGVGLWAERVHVALVELSGDFREHLVVTEGPEGLHRDVVATAPRLCNAVARLTREHVSIADLVSGLLSRLGGPVTVDDLDGICRSGTELLGLLVRHRRRGAHLVYEAYQADIGGEM